MTAHCCCCFAHIGKLFSDQCTLDECPAPSLALSMCFHNFELDTVAREKKISQTGLTIDLEHIDLPDSRLRDIEIGTDFSGI